MQISRGIGARVHWHVQLIAKKMAPNVLAGYDDQRDIDFMVPIEDEKAPGLQLTAALDEAMRQINKIAVDGYAIRSLAVSLHQSHGPSLPEGLLEQLQAGHGVLIGIGGEEISGQASQEVFTQHPKKPDHLD